MSNGFTVEAIVAQIRSRIAAENARKSVPSQTRVSVSEGPAWDAARGRRRMEEDTARFADLDVRLENVARSIGQQPFAPPTWRGRVGGWIVQGLRRLLWWYGLPIKEALAQIGFRNREQAIRHRYLQEDLLAISESLQRAMSRIDGLERAASEAQSEAQSEVQSLRGSIADCQTRVGLVAEQMESRLLDFESSQVGIAKDAARRLREMWEDWNRRDGEITQQITAFNDQVQQLKAAHGVSQSLGANLALRVARLASEAEKEWQRLPDLEARQESAAKAREALTSTLTSTLEKHAGRIRHFDEALQNLGNGFAEVIGRAERLEHATGALNLQLQAEGNAREVLAGVLNGQAGRIEQVNGALAPLAGLPVRVSSLAVAHEKQRSALLLQENRVGMLLREVRHQLPKPLSLEQVRQFTETSSDAIKALYAEFEDTFRGPRELIKERQEVYVPRLIEARAGSSTAPVLDLGCGRGEWLELLADRHLVARGVDSNPGMIERCRALGLNVTLDDALAHLRGLPDRSAGAVTSFQMVEHLPFEIVIALLDEALRVLRTGGILILETPNPQNVLVGSDTFWIDPTHVRPIPSQTLQFFVEARGFCSAEVWNLQPYPEAIRLPQDPAGIGARFNDCFYGPQDYGIIAIRP